VAIDLELDGMAIERAEHFVERGIEQRLEMLAHGGFDEARVEEWRQRIGEPEPHRGTALGH
jgi:hypothetical protein